MHTPEAICAACRDLSPEGTDIIVRAYALAQSAHQGQLRKSGEPYIIHPVQAALTVASWGLDATTVAATLLHDVVEDAGITLEQIEAEFGGEVAQLVDGVTKLSRVRYRGQSGKAETLRKLVLVLAEDVRVVFVKLADRLHNMETLEHVEPEKRSRIAHETADIYAPLAYRLGLGKVSGDLEDLAFRWLDPQRHAWLSQTMADHLEHGATRAGAVRQQTEEALALLGVTYVRIDSRTKRISSLSKKLRRLDEDLDKVYDLVALRIITSSISDCYAALGALHATWRPLPGLVKDYIAVPKPNGYRSLHTTVVAVDGVPVEFQIRTEQMHNENEYGVAAYWAYADAKGGKAQANVQVSSQHSWVQTLKEWQTHLQDPDEFLQAVKVEFFQDRIFCLTPKGEAIDLPAGSCPVDFAYAIHKELGDQTIAARVNGRGVPLDATLQSGDLVEIVTQRGKQPSVSWLEFVKSTKAQRWIRARVKEQMKTDA